MDKRRVQTYLKILPYTWKVNFRADTHLSENGGIADA